MVTIIEYKLKYIENLVVHYYNQKLYALYLKKLLL